MQYYWGLAAGHTYTHSMRNGNPPAEASTASNNVDETDDLLPELGPDDTICLLNQLPEHESDVQHDDDPELGFENRQDDFLGEEDISGDGGIEDNDEFFAMNDMYGFD